jgi:manganese transport protein
LPLIWGVLITVLDTFLFLLLQRLGIRKMEAFIIALVAVIGISFLIEIILAKPDIGAVATGFVPTIPNSTALYIAIGIIGATVMPHNLYLHSALVQTRKIKRDDAGIKKALKLNFIDSTIALNLAFFVNAGILVLAATVFYYNGRTDVAEIKTAHELLRPLLGSEIAPILFAVALIASGQSSTITGTLAGQIVMEGYLDLRIAPWVRRLMTRLIAIIPAVIVILVNGEENIDSLLVLSQVILSLQLGFAIIPLIHFTADKDSMGKYAIRPFVIFLASAIAAVLVYLNIRMVMEQAASFFATSDNLVWKIVIVIAGLFFVSLLFIAIIYPLRKRKEKRLERKVTSLIHAEQSSIENITVPSHDKIAIAIDFSQNDAKLFAHAIGQANKNTSFVLIHVVESVPATILGKESDDLETRNDQQKLNDYVSQLKAKGFGAQGILGFKNRSKEIVRIVKESGADMLVIGAHGHSGLKDLVYGETTDAVRHGLTIPVLVVNL